MKKLYIALLVIVAVATACNEKNSGKEFTINGTIKNSTAKNAYLEQVAILTMQPAIVDSAVIAADGRFILKAKPTESSIYNIRLDNNAYPIASVINDNEMIDVAVDLKNSQAGLSNNYEIKSSPASQRMKDFMLGFNNRVQALFVKAKLLDSLQTAKPADTSIASMQQDVQALSADINTYTHNELKKADNPALTIFELGYHQSTANNAGFGVQPLPDAEVNGIVSDLAKKYPAHNGITAIQASLQKHTAQQQGAGASGSRVGSQAPDFTLNDVNGKPVSLSSFKGKYVLVDFWASWCRPCRMENPNVVAAYNKFKNKNFTILGVSLDDNKEAWQNAIKKDGLVWTHVSDLKQWDSAVIPLYGFEGIPYNVLIDPSGKIIGEGLRGSDLEAKLLEILH